MDVERYKHRYISFNPDGLLRGVDSGKTNPFPGLSSVATSELSLTMFGHRHGFGTGTAGHPVSRPRERRWSPCRRLLATRLPVPSAAAQAGGKVVDINQGWPGGKPCVYAGWIFPAASRHYWISRIPGFVGLVRMALLCAVAASSACPIDSFEPSASTRNTRTAQGAIKLHGPTAVAAPLVVSWYSHVYHCWQCSGDGFLFRSLFMEIA